jgi:hypothetical protein
VQSELRLRTSTPLGQMGQECDSFSRNPKGGMTGNG